jgi:C4-dicarboxylate transporter, DctQ subunit
VSIASNKSRQTSAFANFCQRLIARLHQIEDTVLVSVLSAMIVLAALQIFLRNFFDSGISWVDPLLRSMVLWVGLLGALVAARSNKHISIDIFSRVVPVRVNNGISVITHAFVVFISSIIAWYAASFVWSDYQEGTIAFGIIPSWMIEMIIPFSFLIIALRYALLGLLQLQALLKVETG